MKEFQEAALRAGAQNPLIEALNYIDQHLDGKLTLPELAQMSCMERALLLQEIQRTDEDDGHAVYQ